MINVGIDWVQVATKSTINRSQFEFIDTGNRSRQFSRIEEIYYDGIKLGVIESEPYSNIIDSNLKILKIENSVLYLENPFEIIDELLLGLNIKINNITRLDLYIDSDTVIDFEILKASSAIKYKGFKAIYYNDDQIQTCMIGKRSSGSQFVIYNKSKEINDNNKLHLKEYKKNVFKNREFIRYEVRLYSPVKKIINKETGEIKEIEYKKLREKEYLKQLIDTYLKRKIIIGGVDCYYLKSENVENLQLKYLPNKNVDKMVRLNQMIKNLIVNYGKENAFNLVKQLFNNH